MGLRAASEVENSTRRIAAERITRWARGHTVEESAGSRAIWLESSDHLEFALTLCADERDTIFCPGPIVPGASGPATVLSYEGSLDEPGDEVFVADELFVYTQDYLATPYLAVAGLTTVRITGDRDHEEFLRDADLAHRKGVFLEQLLHPAVFLCDLAALCGEQFPGRLVRFHVSAAGEVRSEPGGAVLGATASTLAELEAAQRISEAPATARESRSWLPRYLRAIDVLRGLMGAGRSPYHVSGFGRRLVEGLGSGVVEPASAPMVLWNDDEFLICDPLTGRVFDVGPDAAKFVETLLIIGNAPDAKRVAGELLGFDSETTGSAIDALIASFTELGVDLVRSPR